MCMSSPSSRNRVQSVVEEKKELEHISKRKKSRDIELIKERQDFVKVTIWHRNQWAEMWQSCATQRLHRRQGRGDGMVRRSVDDATYLRQANTPLPYQPNRSSLSVTPTNPPANRLKISSIIREHRSREEEERMISGGSSPAIKSSDSTFDLKSFYSIEKDVKEIMNKTVQECQELRKKYTMDNDLLRVGVCYLNEAQKHQDTRMLLAQILDREVDKFESELNTSISDVSWVLETAKILAENINNVKDEVMKSNNPESNTETNNKGSKKFAQDNQFTVSFDSEPDTTSEYYHVGSPVRMKTRSGSRCVDIELSSPTTETKEIKNTNSEKEKMDDKIITEDKKSEIVKTTEVVQINDQNLNSENKSNKNTINHESEDESDETEETESDESYDSSECEEELEEEEEEKDEIIKIPEANYITQKSIEANGRQIQNISCPAKSILEVTAGYLLSLPAVKIYVGNDPKCDVVLIIRPEMGAIGVPSMDGVVQKDAFTFTGQQSTTHRCLSGITYLSPLQDGKYNITISMQSSRCLVTTTLRIDVTSIPEDESRVNSWGVEMASGLRESVYSQLEECLTGFQSGSNIVISMYKPASAFKDDYTFSMLGVTQSYYEIGEPPSKEEKKQFKSYDEEEKKYYEDCVQNTTKNLSELRSNAVLPFILKGVTSSLDKDLVDLSYFICRHSSRESILPITTKLPSNYEDAFNILHCGSEGIFSESHPIIQFRKNDNSSSLSLLQIHHPTSPYCVNYISPRPSIHQIIKTCLSSSNPNYNFDSLPFYVLPYYKSGLSPNINFCIPVEIRSVDLPIRKSKVFINEQRNTSLEITSEYSYYEEEDPEPVEEAPTPKKSKKKKSKTNESNDPAESTDPTESQVEAKPKKKTKKSKSKTGE